MKGIPNRDDNLILHRVGKSMNELDLNMHGFFSALIMFPANYTAGVAVAFNMSNGDIFKTNQEEIDFEGLFQKTYSHLQTTQYSSLHKPHTTALTLTPSLTSFHLSVFTSLFATGRPPIAGISPVCLSLLQRRHYFLRSVIQQQQQNLRQISLLVGEFLGFSPTISYGFCDAPCL